MPTVSDLLREHLMSIAPDVDSYSYKALTLSEWCHEFESLMRNRLIMGSMRYGKKIIEQREPGHTEFILKLIEGRLDAYKKTGNRELLVDIANMSLIEFMHSDHPMRHFMAVDDRKR